MFAASFVLASKLIIRLDCDMLSLLGVAQIFSNLQAADIYFD